MTDPFVDRIKRARTDKGETVSGRMVETRSQKTSEERKEMLEVEVNTVEVLDRVFCIELEEYRPSELGSIIFRSKRTELRKKLGGTYKREIF